MTIDDAVLEQFERLSSRVSLADWQFGGSFREPATGRLAVDVDTRDTRKLASSDSWPGYRGSSACLLRIFGENGNSDLVEFLRAVQANLPGLLFEVRRLRASQAHLVGSSAPPGPKHRQKTTSTP